MTRTAIFPTACILAAALLSSSFPAVALAQDAAQPPAPVDLSSRQPAQQVRERFMEILSRQPPALGRVLKLDPALMLNDAYLAPYPEVAQFLRQYPEVPRNPGYFLERVNISTTGYAHVGARSGAARVLQHGRRLHGLPGVPGHHVRHHLADPHRDRAAAMGAALPDSGRRALEADGPVLVERRADGVRADTRQGAASWSRVRAPWPSPGRR
jgi:hypothetical protein